MITAKKNEPIGMTSTPSLWTPSSANPSVDPNMYAIAPSTMAVNAVTTAANARPMMNATAISTRLPFAMNSRNSFSMTASLPRLPAP